MNTYRNPTPGQRAWAGFILGFIVGGIAMAISPGMWMFSVFVAAIVVTVFFGPPQRGSFREAKEFMEYERERRNIDA